MELMFLSKVLVALVLWMIMVLGASRLMYLRNISGSGVSVIVVGILVASTTPFPLISILGI
jgi:hypothetical protein